MPHRRQRRAQLRGWRLGIILCQALHKIGRQLIQCLGDAIAGQLQQRQLHRRQHAGHDKRRLRLCGFGRGHIISRAENRLGLRRH